MYYFGTAATSKFLYPATQVVCQPGGVGPFKYVPLLLLLGTGLFPVDVVAAGASQATATQLTLARNYVLSGTGGVVLPQASTFSEFECLVFNRTGAAITVYPFPGDTIETNAVNVGVTISNYSLGRFSVDVAGVLRMA